MILLLQNFYHYLIEILPALAIGFLLSGIIHEFIPTKIIEKYLSGKGLKPILLLTLIGTVLPICCWGTLPMAITFHKKGIKLGPIFAFLVATPATSVSAFLVTLQVLGLKFAIFIFVAVIIIGLVLGIIGNHIQYTPKGNKDQIICSRCNLEERECNCHKKIANRIKSILTFAFVQMPREIGPLTLLGIFLAAMVVTITPIGVFIKNFLTGSIAYPLALIFGILMYFCSTSSPPLVDALIRQGMNPGAGMVLLLIGPVTSYGTLLVFGKEFGFRVVIIYLIVLSILSLGLGYLFSFLINQ
ncbi:MAG: permease [candidate division WOR-3 bacterium]|nr:permease [candidate division WOR-3 bacterium]